MIICTTEEDIFLFDYWKDYLALGYIVGIKIMPLGDESPDGLIWSLDGLLHTDSDESDLYRYYSLEYIRIKNIWKSGKHPSENPPSYYIDWALSKNIAIPWLEWAIDKGYYTSKENKKSEKIDAPLHKRLENNYLRLIFALANGVEGFNPRNPYESAKLIIDETDIKLSQDTIADYITRAYELSSKEKE